MYGGSHIIFPPTKIKELKGIQVTRHMPMIMFQEIYIVLYVHLASFLRQKKIPPVSIDIPRIWGQYH